MSILGAAHICDDVNQTFLPALLPFLVAHRGLSYTAAAGLVLAASISSSVVQPVIGHLSDRRSSPWLIAAGVFLAGGGLALVGFMPTYSLIVLAVVVSGIGVATFHPEAARFANFVAGAHKASGMRWFTVGGNVGFAIGPLFAAAAIAAFGLRGTLLAAVPTTLAAVLVAAEVPRLLTFVPARRTRTERDGVDRWSAFARLTAFVVVRSMAYVGIVTFTPLYFVGILHATPAQGSIALGLALACGAIGNLVGGPLADRFGRRALLRWSTALGIPLLLGFVWSTAALHSVLLGDAFMMAAAFWIVMAQTAFVVLGQEYLPHHVGTASGVTLGLAISLGGAASPALGALADHAGLVATMLAIVGLLALALAFSWTLPRDRRAATGVDAVPRAAPVAAAG